MKGGDADVRAPLLSTRDLGNPLTALRVGICLVALLTGNGEAQRGGVTHPRPLSLGVADPNPGLSDSEAHAGVTEPGGGDEGLSLKAPLELVMQELASCADLQTSSPQIPNPS